MITLTIAEAKKKLVELARSQVGYCEGLDNYTKYAADSNITKLYGWNVQNQPWCCTFVNWCFINAFGYDLGTKLTYGGTAACANSASLFRNHGAFVQEPEVGDQIFFYSNGGINHTGIVVEVNGSTIRTVEGNYSDKVGMGTYILGNNVIAGFGRPQWSLVEGEDVATAVLPLSQPVEENHHWKPGDLKRDVKYNKSVVVLQSLLNVRGFDCGKADGYFGVLTEAAVNHAKRYYDQPRDGVCDYALWIKLLMIER